VCIDFVARSLDDLKNKESVGDSFMKQQAIVQSKEKELAKSRLQYVCFCCCCHSSVLTHAHLFLSSVLAFESSP
jgi:hypothetical protein